MQVSQNIRGIGKQLDYIEQQRQTEYARLWAALEACEHTLISDQAGQVPQPRIEVELAVVYRRGGVESYENEHFVYVHDFGQSQDVIEQMALKHLNEQLDAASRANVDDATQAVDVSVYYISDENYLLPGEEAEL